MKFQPGAYKHCLLLLLAHTISLLVYAQDTSVAKVELRSQYQGNGFSNGHHQYIPGRRGFHGGFGLTTGLLNAKNSVSEGFAFGFGYDILKFRSSSLSFETNIKWGVENIGWGDLANVGLGFFSDGGGAPQVSTTSTTFAEFPMLLNYSINFGPKNNERPAFGVYFGCGMSYVITAYQSSTSYTEGASFYGCVINGGVRFGYLDIGFEWVSSLRAPIDQIANPSFYELTLAIGK